jgi:U3 small nucleolar RNA-associated protein 10
MLRIMIQRSSRSEVVRDSTNYFDVFFQLFDLRRTNEVEGLTCVYETTVLETLEDTVRSTAIEMTMKLNDRVFRPFFVRLVDWAAKSSSESEPKSRELRCITFFSFFEKLSHSLKVS